MAAPPDLGCWVSPFSPFSTVQGFFQKKTVPDCGQLKMASVKLGPADGSLRKMACLGCDVPIPGWFQQEKVMSGTDQKTPQGTSLVFQWLVKPLHFHCRGHWFDPCQGTKITAAWPKKKKKQPFRLYPRLRTCDWEKKTFCSIFPSEPKPRCLKMRGLGWISLGGQLG